MFRRPLLLLLLIALPTMAAGKSRPPMAPVTISKTELAPGIYQFQVASDGYVEQLNCVAIVNDADVLVFDTTTRPSTARTILSELRKITPKPVRFVVNSHWHPDHWSGNEVFAEANPELEIIATEKERDFMLNLASFGPDEHQLMIQAGIDGLHDILELDLDAFGARVARAAGELGVEPPSDLTLEGWWEQAKTLEDE